MIFPRHNCRFYNSVFLMLRRARNESPKFSMYDILALRAQMALDTNCIPALVSAITTRLFRPDQVRDKDWLLSSKNAILALGHIAVTLREKVTPHIASDLGWISTETFTGGAYEGRSEVLASVVRFQLELRPRLRPPSHRPNGVHCHLQVNETSS